jgi:hypothetical protein
MVGVDSPAGTIAVVEYQAAKWPIYRDGDYVRIDVERRRSGRMVRYSICCRANWSAWDTPGMVAELDCFYERQATGQATIRRGRYTTYRHLRRYQVQANGTTGWMGRFDLRPRRFRRLMEFVRRCFDVEWSTCMNPPNGYRTNPTNN